MELLKVVALPLVTLILGYLFNASLNERQSHESYVRLYADMMGRREEADSALRKDMFKSILDTFLTKDPKQPRGQYFEQEVLNIELLAYNFHESLDLGPLFKHVRRELAENKKDVDESLLWRLEKVASGVKEQQLAVLSDSGIVESGDINVRSTESSDWGAMRFGKSTIELKPDERRSGPTLCMSIDSSEGQRHYRQFKIVFLDFDKDKREVEFKLYVSRPIEEQECGKILDAKVELDNVEASPQFWVGEFAFPMIDNTHLSHSERCSVSITDITNDNNAVKIAVSFFKASRASLKDKPYYDEILHDLLRNPATEVKER